MLTGTANLSGAGNALANVLTGNAGDNLLTGGGGDDAIDGGEGRDTAVFSGLTTDYEFVSNVDGSIDVIDKRGGNPDGRDTLRNIEVGAIQQRHDFPQTAAGPHPAGKCGAHRRERTRIHIRRRRSFQYVGGRRGIVPSGRHPRRQVRDRLGEPGIITVVGAVNYEATTAEDPNLQTETVAPGVQRKFYVLMVQATSSGGIALPSVSVPVKGLCEQPQRGPDRADFRRRQQCCDNHRHGCERNVVGTLLSSDPDGDTQLVYRSTAPAMPDRAAAAMPGGCSRSRAAQLKFAKVPTATKLNHTGHPQGHGQEWRSGSTSYYKDFLINFDPPPPVGEVPVLSIVAADAVKDEGQTGSHRFHLHGDAALIFGLHRPTRTITTGGNITGDDFGDTGTEPTDARPRKPSPS